MITLETNKEKKNSDERKSAVMEQKKNTVNDWTIIIIIMCIYNS